MPGFDGTGPAGRGPRTGGARGWCNPFNASYAGYRSNRLPYGVPGRSGYAYGTGRPRWGLGRGNRGRGFGSGRGRSFGRGRGWWR